MEGEVLEGEAELLAEIERWKKISTSNAQTIKEREIRIAELEDQLRTLKQIPAGDPATKPVPDKESSWTFFEEE